MLERIPYNEINLNDKGNFTMDITKDKAIDKKSFWLVKNTLLVAFL